MKFPTYLLLLLLFISATALAQTSIATRAIHNNAQAIPAPAELVPESLTNGELFYAIFVTSGLHDAESDSPQTYNNFVNSVADGSSVKATNHPDIEWKALVATKQANQTHAVFNLAPNRPIYNLQGEKVADNAEQLLSGRLFSKIKYTETGSHAASPLLVWTGLMANGEQAENFVLGNKQAALGSYVFQGNGVRHFKIQDSYFAYRFYAVSPLLINKEN